MSSQKSLIAGYLKHRFFERFDVKGHDLSAIALRKLRNNLPEDKFQFFQQLDSATNSIIEIISEDTERDGTPNDEKIINDYEKLADDKNLPRAVRIQMYDLVLTGHEKYIEGNTLYLNVLNKKLSLLNKNHISDLKHAAMLIKQHSFGVLYSLKHKLLSAVRKKLSDNDYPNPKESAMLKSMSVEEKKQHRIALARQKVADIDQRLNKSLPPDEKIELLLQKLNALSNCGLGRLKTCRAKYAVYQELEYLSIVNHDMEAADFYAHEQTHQDEVVNNIFKYVRLRAKGRKV